MSNPVSHRLQLFVWQNRVARVVNRFELAEHNEKIPEIFRSRLFVGATLELNPMEGYATVVLHFLEGEISQRSFVRNAVHWFIHLFSDSLVSICDCLKSILHDRVLSFTNLAFDGISRDDREYRVFLTLMRMLLLLLCYFDDLVEGLMIRLRVRRSLLIVLF